MARSATRAAFALLIACFWSVGCTESDVPPERAPRAAEELMPVPAPQFDPEVLADQAQAKLAVAREAPSYEPLETFRQARKERELSKIRRPAATPTITPGGASPAAVGGEGNFWKRLGLKALMGGPPPSQPVEPAESGAADSQDQSDSPPADDEEPSDSDSAAEEDESDPEESDAEREVDAADDEASDDEEPADEDEGDDEDAAEGSDEDEDAEGDESEDDDAENDDAEDDSADDEETANDE